MSIIKVNFEKFKEIVHDMRRYARSNEFRPWDLKYLIPSEQATAELERQKIRDKYVTIQIEIDTASTVDELKNILNKYQKFNFS